VRVEPKTIGIAAITQLLCHEQDDVLLTNDLFLSIASCHETESSTGGTIAPADLLPAEYRL